MDRKDEAVPIAKQLIGDQPEVISQLIHSRKKKRHGKSIQAQKINYLKGGGGGAYRLESQTNWKAVIKTTKTDQCASSGPKNPSLNEVNPFKKPSPLYQYFEVNSVLNTNKTRAHGFEEYIRKVLDPVKSQKKLKPLVEEDTSGIEIKEPKLQKNLIANSTKSLQSSSKKIQSNSPLKSELLGIENNNDGKLLYLAGLKEALSIKGNPKPNIMAQNVRKIVEKEELQNLLTRKQLFADLVKAHLQPNNSGTSYIDVAATCKVLLKHIDVYVDAAGKYIIKPKSLSATHLTDKNDFFSRSLLIKGGSNIISPEDSAHSKGDQRKYFGRNTQPYPGIIATTISPSSIINQDYIVKPGSAQSIRKKEKNQDSAIIGKGLAQKKDMEVCFKTIKPNYVNGIQLLGETLSSLRSKDKKKDPIEHKVFLNFVSTASPMPKITEFEAKINDGSTEFAFEKLTSREVFAILEGANRIGERKRKDTKINIKHRPYTNLSRHPINIIYRLINIFLTYTVHAKDQTQINANLGLAIGSILDLGITKSHMNISTLRNRDFGQFVKERLLKILYAVINEHNGMKIIQRKPPVSNYKCYVGKGNNNEFLVRTVIKQRWWWTSAGRKDISTSNFIWTQWRKNAFYSLLSTNSVLKKQEKYSKHSGIYNQIAYFDRKYTFQSVKY